jgi:alginate O-acetyltransferase complex protein AlgI
LKLCVLATQLLKILSTRSIRPGDAIKRGYLQFDRNGIIEPEGAGGSFAMARRRLKHMLFTSSTFLFAFLPALLAVYYAIPHRFRNSILLAASLLFYSWGQPSGLLLLALSIGVNYGVGRAIDRAREQGRSAVWPLRFGIAFNLACLGIAKYAFFALDNLNWALGSLGVAQIGLRPFGLLLGISFFTFHAISYLVDIYMKRASAQRNIVNYGLYIALFPQLIAGPIVRYRDIAEQLTARRVTTTDLTEGTAIFIVGLAKKLLLANVLAVYADQAFSADARHLTASAAWLGVLCYAGQIYFDFSGYSDMARGLCRLFGFRIINNFDYPYIAQSMQEFWRRWHISLSNWFRDYLYIPLGGNRLGPGRTTMNLLIVFLLCGLWHGAHWNFVLWGLYQGMFLIVERLAAVQNALHAMGRAFRHAYLLLAVGLGWVLFRAESLEHAGNYYGAMFRWSRDAGAVTLDVSPVLIATLGVAVVAATPAARWTYRRWQARAQSSNARRASYELVVTASFAALFGACVSFVALGAYNPFIYFRF